MELITNRSEVILNTYKLYQYSISENLDEKQFAQRMFKKGWVFVAENIGGKILFAPSKFVGYKNNNNNKYFQNKEEGADGRDTNKKLNSIYNSERTDEYLLNCFKTYCNNLGIERNYETDKTIRFFFINENITRSDYKCYFISPTHVSGAKPKAWQSFLNKSIAAIGWNTDDLSGWQWKDVEQRIREEGYDNVSEAVASHGIMYDMQVGDIICCTNNLHALFGIGIIASEYKFDIAIHDTGAATKEDWYNNYVNVSWVLSEYIQTKSIKINIGDTLWEPYGTLKERDPIPNYIKHLLFKDTSEISIDILTTKQQIMPALNTILYGPPGTGKTYNTINKALAIVGYDAKHKDRDTLKKEFDKYVEEGKIVFTTFHQSMSYEDFIEGIKPLKPQATEPLQYDIEEGVFKRISNKARSAFENTKEINKNKLSFEDAFEQLKDEWDNDMSISFPLKTQGYDYTIIGFTNTSIQFKKASGGTGHTLSINTLKEMYYGKEYDFNSGVGIYYPSVLNRLNAYSQKAEKVLSAVAENYVLIIDEINRGNVSQIFGELITLIEEDKRWANREALSVTLPYSKESFSVPPNLYIVGTMNTADRSVEALDTALRRRFVFEEIMPDAKIIMHDFAARFWDLRIKYPIAAWESEVWLNAKKGLTDLLNGANYDYFRSIYEQSQTLNELYEKLDEVAIQKISLPCISIFNAINKRIELLLNRDHLIGHAYFIGKYTWASLQQTFNKNIIPLLQEYFYGDYGKIGLVLGEVFFEKLQTETPNNVFAKFGAYNAETYLEKQVYKLKDVSAMKEEDFKIAIGQLLQSV